MILIVFDVLLVPFLFATFNQLFPGLWCTKLPLDDHNFSYAKHSSFILLTTVTSLINDLLWWVLQLFELGASLNFLHLSADGDFFIALVLCCDMSLELGRGWGFGEIELSAWKDKWGTRILFKPISMFGTCWWSRADLVSYSSQLVWWVTVWKCKQRTQKPRKLPSNHLLGLRIVFPTLLFSLDEAFTLLVQVEI